MDERRKKKRVPLNSTLTIESVFKSGQQKPEKADIDIVITDISKTGMGFSTAELLPIDYYFNAKVVIDADKMFYCVLKIIRSEKIEGVYQYGSEFIGLAEVLAHNIDEYIDETEHSE